MEELSLVLRTEKQIQQIKLINQFKMKKIVVLAIAIVLSLSTFSCKTGEKCPAYGKADVKSTSKRV